MFDIMIKIIVYATWAGLIIIPATLLGLRIYYFIVTKSNLRERLMVLLLPFTVGVELYVPTGRFKKTYRIVTIVGFAFLLCTTLFLFYIFKTN